MKILDDFDKLSTVPETALPSLIEHLNANPFLTPADTLRFEAWCRDHGVQVDSGRQFLKFLGFAAEFSSERRDWDVGLAELKETFFGSGPVPDNFAQVWTRLQTMAPALGPFQQRRKEYRLLAAHKHLHQFSLIVDARPVYDLGRKKIEKFIFPVKVVIRTSGKEDALVVEVTEEDLLNLKGEIESAIEKLGLLRESLAKQRGS